MLLTQLGSTGGRIGKGIPQGNLGIQPGSAEMVFVIAYQWFSENDTGAFFRGGLLAEDRNDRRRGFLCNMVYSDRNIFRCGDIKISDRLLYDTSQGTVLTVL